MVAKRGHNVNFSVPDYIGGSDVLAFLNESNRNADQPHYLDIRTMFENDWLSIWDNLTAQEQVDIANSNGQDPPSYRSFLQSDQMDSFRDVMQVLSCRVVSHYLIIG